MAQHGAAWRSTQPPLLSLIFWFEAYADEPSMAAMERRPQTAANGSNEPREPDTDDTGSLAAPSSQGVSTPVGSIACQVSATNHRLHRGSGCTRRRCGQRSWCRGFVVAQSAAGVLVHAHPVSWHNDHRGYPGFPGVAILVSTCTGMYYVLVLLPLVVYRDDCSCH